MKYFNIYKDRYGMKHLSGPFENVDHSAAYGMAAEEEPDAVEWVGKIVLDISGDEPVMTYREVIR